MTLAALLVSLAATAQASPPGFASSPATIRSALEERSKQSRSLIAEWTEITTIPRGSYSIIFGTPGGPELPDKTIRVRTAHRLVLDGNHGHYKISGEDYDMNANKIRLLNYSSVFDGKKNLECRYFPEGDKDAFSLGYILETKALRAVEKHLFLPILMTVRPADSTLGIDLSLLDHLSPASGTLEGERCDIFTYPRAGDRSEELWITKNDHRIVKKIFRHKGNPVDSTTIIYENDVAGKPSPKRWEIVMRLGERSVLVKSVSATLTSFVVNREIDPSEYEFEFPPGIEVRRLDRDSKVMDRYLSDGGGRLRPLSRDSRESSGLTGGQDHPLSLTRGGIRRVAIMIASVAVVALVATLFIVRRRLARSSPPTSH